MAEPTSSPTKPETITRVFDSCDARGMPVPWWMKIAAKLVLSHCLPNYRHRRRLGLCVHSYAAGNGGHPGAIRDDIAHHVRVTGRSPRSLLELGPGDGLANALFAAAAGVTTIWMVDAGDFASSDMRSYGRIVQQIARDNPEFAKSVNLSSRAAMLTSIGARYLIAGTESLRYVPTSSVDLIVSYATIEHVRRHDLSRLFEEMNRLLVPGGIAHHWIDLMDHLGGRLNNLRISASIWEHELMAGGGFYTNRSRCTELVELARTAGFETAVPALSRWPELPTPRRAMSHQFRRFDDEELRIASFDLLLRRPLLHFAPTPAS
jgi:SAM-dependent methyltransferase